jgi:hypothetical protein
VFQSIANALVGTRGATITVTVFLALLGGFWVNHLPNVGGDTPGLVAGAQVIRQCVSAGQLRSCGVPPNGQMAHDTPAPTFTAVGPYPLLQYVPATLGLALGLSATQVLTGLSLLSLAAFFAMLWLLWRTAAPGWGPVLVLIALASPLLFYAYSTLGEMLTAFLLVATVAVAASSRTAWLIALVALLAGITKETSPPFVFAFGALAIALVRVPGDRWGPLLCLVGGVLAAVAANAAFNIFRYGVVQNRDYLQSQYRVHGIPRVAGLFGALLVAPNGGIWLFWASAMVLLGAAVVFGLAGKRHTARWPALALAGIFVVLLGGLATWWAPFGWYTWGPRLTLPWIPPLLLLAVMAYGGAMLPTLRRATAGFIATALVSAVVTLSALPQLGVLFDPAASNTIFLPDSACPVGIVGGSPAYYRCLDHQAWGRHMVLLGALDGTRQPSGIVFSVSMFLAGIGLLGFVRTQLSDDSVVPRERVRVAA